MLRHNQNYFGAARRAAQRLKGARELSARLVFRPSLLVNSQCMARRAAFLAVGGYDPEVPVCEDADLYGRIAESSGYVYVDRTVVRYRTGLPSLMHNLAESDEKLHVAYRRIQDKYRLRHGLLKFFALKAWTRAILH
jgi:GT2 family glycosyltransferase